MDAPNLVEETLALDGLALSILRPADPEALLSEDAFEQEEFLPYWAEVWPSGIALARVLRGRVLAGRRVLELGCGLGIPSIVAALGGAHVVATDWSPDAIDVTTANAARNGAELETALCSWADAGALVQAAPWEVVLAADVLYERRNVDELLALLPRLIDERGEILLAEPGRPAATRFFEVARECFLVEEVATRVHRLRAA